MGTCAKCRGRLVLEVEDGLDQEHCSRCGTLRFLDVPHDPPANGSTSNQRLSPVWEGIVPALPESFKFMALLKQLWHQEPGWTSARLRTVLEAKGYEMYQVPIVVVQVRKGPLWARRIQRRSA